LVAKPEERRQLDKDMDGGKYKDKVVPLYAMKVYVGSRSITPLILNLGARWR
jgi:hypothetical protein